jgi:hypothetical protein
LLKAHAEAKYLSFREEIDANVFPCLGDRSGCLRLMTEIAEKDSFLPGATWLVTCNGSGGPVEYCGTVQGICENLDTGSIQNLGVTPPHRGRGLGTLLLLRALEGFRAAGLDRVLLEVTAHNESAVRLYKRLGFAKVRIVYKAVEVVDE